MLVLAVLERAGILALILTDHGIRELDVEVLLARTDDLVFGGSWVAGEVIATDAVISDELGRTSHFPCPYAGSRNT